MRIGLLLLCFYGLSSSVAYASTLSTEDLSPDAHISRFSPLNRLSRGDLSWPGVSLKRSSSIDAHRSLISSARSIEINPGADITVSANLPLIPTGKITLLPGRNISLTNLAKKDLTSATLIPRLSGGDITIWKAGTIAAGSGALLLAGNIKPLSGGNISLDSGNSVPPTASPSAGGEIMLAPGSDIITMSGVSVASVPLPASLYMLMTGVLTLLSISRRSVSREAHS